MRELGEILAEVRGNIENACARSGRDPKEIAEDDFGFIGEIGLKENLSLLMAELQSLGV